LNETPFILKKEKGIVETAVQMYPEGSAAEGLDPESDGTIA
jgi:hypothetical protein